MNKFYSTEAKLKYMHQYMDFHKVYASSPAEAAIHAVKVFPYGGSVNETIRVKVTDQKGNVNEIDVTIRFDVKILERENV